MKIDHSQGWTEAVIDSKCSIDKFYKIAEILKTTLGIFFSNKLSDTESHYWDFTYKARELTLRYNTYTGISIFPKSLKNSTESDSLVLLDVYNTLSDNFKLFDTADNFVARYFDPEPIQWGLRGDPHLWRDMKQKTESANIPTTANELEKLLHKLFKNLVGEPPQKGKFIHVEKYETIGMSRGMICSDFWLDKGFSLIIQRYIESELR
ncbi:hypothetical protein QWZ08_02675 [Ferruginibacter paludis]|uniref:hypothetical protein n=1 Tax=Ferruginibacter paludis TaxID=1310417 RepID=UPI0025B56252|nr:hypothetical protein [Ferruginibacter paludis]MDN3654512.1 hypothetical protein [Ferruginibacter paludis]